MPGLGQIVGFGTPSLPATHTTGTLNRDANDERDVWVITTVLSVETDVQSGTQLWRVYAVPPLLQTVATGVPPLLGDVPCVCCDGCELFGSSRMVWLAAHFSVTANNDANADRAFSVTVTTVGSLVGAVQSGTQPWCVYAVPALLHTVATGLPPMLGDVPCVCCDG